MRWAMVLVVAMGVTTPYDGWAATAHVQEKFAAVGGSADLSVTFNSTVTAGNVLAGYVRWFSGTVTLNSVDDNCGNTHTLLHNPTTGTGASAALFYVENAAGGLACAITLHFSASTNISVGVHEISGAATSGALDKSALVSQTDPGTGSDGITSGSVTTTTNGQYIFGGVGDWGYGATATSGTGYTSRTSGTNGFNTESQIQTSAGSIASTWTSSSAGADYLPGIMTFKAATASTAKGTLLGVYP